MPVTDPIADMLTRIRNANIANQDATEIPSSKLKGEIARVLKEEGYIDGFEVVGADAGKPRLRIYMKTAHGKQRKAITNLKRISKPGLRVYAGKAELPRVLGGLGIAIISTPKGILTDKSCRQAGVGGEVLAYVW